MGRKKIRIEKITQPKNRQVTFNKRKVGLMKKAMELSILCDCEIAVIIFSQGELYQYSSKQMEEFMNKYKKFDGPFEALTNKDLTQLKPGKAASFRVGTKKRKKSGAEGDGGDASAGSGDSEDEENEHDNDSQEQEESQEEDGGDQAKKSHKARRSSSSRVSDAPAASPSGAALAPAYAFSTLPNLNPQTPLATANPASGGGLLSPANLARNFSLSNNLSNSLQQFRSGLNSGGLGGGFASQSQFLANIPGPLGTPHASFSGSSGLLNMNPYLSMPPYSQAAGLSPATLAGLNQLNNLSVNSPQAQTQTHNQLTNSAIASASAVTKSPHDVRVSSSHRTPPQPHSASAANTGHNNQSPQQTPHSAQPGLAMHGSASNSSTVPMSSLFNSAASDKHNNSSAAMAMTASGSHDDGNPSSLLSKRAGFANKLLSLDIPVKPEDASSQLVSAEEANARAAADGASKSATNPSAVVTGHSHAAQGAANSAHDNGPPTSLPTSSFHGHGLSGLPSSSLMAFDPAMSPPSMALPMAMNPSESIQQQIALLQHQQQQLAQSQSQSQHAQGLLPSLAGKTGSPLHSPAFMNPYSSTMIDPMNYSNLHALMAANNYGNSAFLNTSALASPAIFGPSAPLTAGLQPSGLMQTSASTLYSPTALRSPSAAAFFARDIFNTPHSGSQGNNNNGSPNISK